MDKRAVFEKVLGEYERLFFLQLDSVIKDIDIREQIKVLVHRKLTLEYRLDYKNAPDEDDGDEGTVECGICREPGMRKDMHLSLEYLYLCSKCENNL
jgi:hypothetical protein